MTIEQVSPTPITTTPARNVGGRPKGSGDKVLNDIVVREKRKLARIEMERSAEEARAAAEEITKIVAIRAQQRAIKHEAYTVQEAKRAPQFQIDQRVTLYVLGFLALVTFLTTAALSADGTIGAASTAKYAVPWFGYLLFGGLEIATLAFMLIYYVLGSRIDYDGNPVPANRWFLMMVAVAFIAVGLSVYHVMDAYAFDWNSGPLWVGVVIRLVTTVIFVIVAKGIATVLFAKAVKF